MKSTPPSLPEPLEIVIIGAGVGGATTALAFAALGYRVILLEARDHVGLGDDKSVAQKILKNLATSWINPGRAGHGFHYIDLETGKMLMESTIQVLREYPEIRAAAAYLGRYFITKNSLFPKEKILEIYAQLQEHYRLLVKKDPKNQVLGHPDDFFRILKPEEYQDIVDAKQVDVGIETTEQLICPPLLAKAIFDKVKEEKNITLLTASKVTQVCYGKDKIFQVMLKGGHSIATDYVINCAWEGMEAIDQTLGLFDPSVKCNNRLKVIAIVDLPPELYEQNSMFFCMGAFCMFSNCGNGKGLLTYAPVTNVCNYQDSKIDETGRRLLSGEASPEEMESYGQRIISGVAQWIPAMSKARLIAVRFGIVKTYGEIDIFDPQSAVHSRNYFGVDCKQIHWIDNACMKLMNMVENSKLVLELFHQNLHAENTVKTLAEAIVQQSKTHVPNELLNLCLAHYLRRQYLPKDLSPLNTKAIGNSLIEAVNNKSLLCVELRSFPKAYHEHLTKPYLSLITIFPTNIAKTTMDYYQDGWSITHKVSRDLKIAPTEYADGLLEKKDSPTVELFQESFAESAMSDKIFIDADIFSSLKDYPVPLTILYLFIYKIYQKLPNVLAKIVSDYCEDDPSFCFWPALHVKDYMTKSLKKEITATVDDSSIKLLKGEFPTGVDDSFIDRIKQLGVIEELKESKEKRNHEMKLLKKEIPADDSSGNLIVTQLRIIKALEKPEDSKELKEKRRHEMKSADRENLVLINNSVIKQRKVKNRDINYYSYSQLVLLNSKPAPQRFSKRLENKPVFGS